VKVLVAGIGNIFLSDDGFGSEVAQRVALRGADLPPDVKVEDFGIRGVHLAYELLDGYDALVLVDAMPLHEEPGTVCIVEPDPPEPVEAGDDVAPALDAHSMSPGVVLHMLASLGGTVDRIVVIGCEPATVEDGIGLSDPVAAAVEEAVDAVLEVIDELCSPSGRTTDAGRTKEAVT
jgi:hydrogenase maturation protease